MTRASRHETEGWFASVCAILALISEKRVNVKEFWKSLFCIESGFLFVFEMELSNGCRFGCLSASDVKYLNSLL